ncbi:antibiotic biosynthesis monooxygenase [Streptomyces sp. NPDC002888]|uniref:antibiotic biosynthesis monooxygenase n=1 Tax=Streptomyces sp. NPDC002888 TaxID=3364668 RepID=UPI0036B3B831
MTRRTDAHPDPADPRVRSPLFSTWRVGTPTRQRQTVEAFAAAWERRPWPDGDLLAHHVYTGHDTATVLHYSQWTKTPAQERVDEIDSAVPGIERLGPGRYQRYRSRERAAGDVRVPGLIVTVRIDFEPHAAEQRRDWIDTVLRALADDPAGHRGLIAAHFHLGGDGDGTHILNYAEWESAGAYDAAMAAPGEGVGSPTDLWERVRTYPGAKGFTGSRYDHALGLVPG